MIFQNLENIYLIGVIFIAHRLIKSYPSLLFPLENIPFVRLVESKQEKTKKDKKKEKEMEKKILKGQKLISYEKGILIGNLKNMLDINYLVDFMQFQYIISTVIGMSVMKLTSFVIYEFFGLKSKYLEAFLVKNNLFNILMVACVIFIFVKLVRYKLMYNGIKGSESLSSFIFTFIFSFFTGILIYACSKYLVVNVDSALNQFNLNIQLIFAVISQNPKNPIFFKISKESFNLFLLGFSLFSSWILASPILKFGKIYNIVNSAIREDEENLENLEGNKEKNKESIEKISGILKGNKKRIRFLLLSLTIDILIILTFIKPIVKDLLEEQYLKNYHGMVILILSLISLCFKLYTSKIELQVKYTSLFQRLLNFRPKDEIYHDIYKDQIDFIYKESLKDAFLIFSKVILPLFIVFLGLSLEIRGICYKDIKGDIAKSVFKKTYTGNELKTKILMNGYDIFSQLKSNGICPLDFENRLLKIETGYGIVRGLDLQEKLKNGEFGGYLNLASLNGNPLFVQFIRFYLFIVYFYKFFGSVFYIFYVMKTEEYY